MAIRVALVATRLRVTRQLLTESVLIALLGAALGLAFASWTTKLLTTFKLPYPVPISLDLSLDYRVLSFTLVQSFLTSMPFGLAPALQASKPSLPWSLKDQAPSAARKSRRFSLRNLLVMTQTAVALVLLIIAGLFLTSLHKAQSMAPGFDPKNVLTVSLDPKLDGFSDTQSKVFYEQLLERV